MQDMKGKVGIGINGFGRIGRLALRAVFTRYSEELSVVAINDPFLTTEYLSYLLTHDTVHGRPKFVVGEVTSDSIVVDNKKIHVFSQKDASQIPWDSVGAEYICECSGVYNTTEKSMGHLHEDGGAKKVVLSAPAKDTVTPTFVLGVNEQMYHPSMRIVSNASCTTNCVTPLVKIVNDKFGIVEGFMTTIHAMTASQSVVDGISRKDWRAGRCATQNIIPATTGAAIAVTKVVPELEGKLNGMALRVPVADVSVVDLTLKLQRPIDSIHDIAQAIIDLHSKIDNTGAVPDMAQIIGVTTEEMVSSDFIGDDRSCILDETASMLLNPTFVKLVAYYDNEWAYALRLVSSVHA